MATPSDHTYSPKPSAISTSLFVHEGILRVASLPEIVILDEGADGLWRDYAGSSCHDTGRPAGR